MAFDLSFDVRLAGPLFAGNAGRRLLSAVDDGLEQVALKGQALVQGQLSPGHGVQSAHFRRSIHGGLTSHLHAQVDAGLQQQGANVVYTGWLEGTSRRNRPRPGFPGYHVFEQATAQLGRMDLARIVGPRIVRALS